MAQSQIKHSLAQLSEHPKIQTAAATFTTASGVLTVLQIIPIILGCIATIMGMILTYYMISNVKLDRKKRKREIKIMEKEHICEACHENRRKHVESK